MRSDLNIPMQVKVAFSVSSTSFLGANVSLHCSFSPSLLLLSFWVGLGNNQTILGLYFYLLITQCLGQFTRGSTNLRGLISPSTCGERSHPIFANISTYWLFCNVVA